MAGRIRRPLIEVELAVHTEPHLAVFVREVRANPNDRGVQRGGLDQQTFAMDASAALDAIAGRAAPAGKAEPRRAQYLEFDFTVDDWSDDCIDGHGLVAGGAGHQDDLQDVRRLRLDGAGSRLVVRAEGPPSEESTSADQQNGDVAKTAALHRHRSLLSLIEHCYEFNSSIAACCRSLTS